MCAYVDQKPVFIRGTILDHISYTSEKLDIKACIEAAKLTNAHTFIKKFPKGYNHKLGESGAGLSGGQLQRLEITRGIAANKPIVILDEPTNNLDKKNKADVFRMLKRIKMVRNIAILIVTHDTEILEYCDKVIKL